MSNIHEQAIKYLEQGLSVIPLQPRGKKPLILWEKYQKQRATVEEVNKWFKQWPDANIGIVTGEISGIIVIDVDSEDAMKLIQAKGGIIAPTVKTGKGYHLYCKYIDGVRNFQKRDDLKGIDLRAEGGYVVASPSVHKSGHVYQRITEQGMPLGDVPEWILARNESEKTPLKKLYEGVPDGERHVSLARLVGSWVNDGLSIEECLANARIWNSKNNPPIEDEKEIIDAVKGIFEKHHNKSSSIEITERKTELVHPALDFTSKDCLVTLPLNLLINGDDKHHYWVVTDKKDLFPLTKDELSSRGMHAGKNFFVIGNNWQYKESIAPWIKGDLRSNPQVLYSDVKRKFEHYLDYVEERIYTYNALWSIGTYFFPLFQAYPIVFFNGPSGSGKSKTIKVVSKLAFNAYHATDVSDASLFRIIHGSRASVLLDENEKLSNAHDSMGQMNQLLGGFIKGSPILRTEKNADGNFTPVAFDIYSPKMIANIRGFSEDALKNRCVTFIMTPTKSVKANDYPDEKKWVGVLNHLYIFMMEHWKEIEQESKSIKGEDYGLFGYGFMVWHPILTMAKYLDKFVNEPLFNQMLSLAQEKTAEREKEKRYTNEIAILNVVKNLFESLSNTGDKNEMGDIFISSRKIRDGLVIELGFADDNVPAWFTPSNIGKKVLSLDIGKQDSVKNVRGLYVNKDRLILIRKRFGLE